MELKVNQLYKNKTYSYLYPVLKGYGNTFINKFNPVFKLAVGVHDTLLDGSTVSKSSNLYVLTDTKINETKFQEFKEWVTCQDYCIADYCPDSEINKSRKYMFVIKIPPEYEKAYGEFLKGNYSKMYNENALNLLFQSKDSKEYKVLTKDPKVIPLFIKKLEEEFGTQVSQEEIEDAEYDLPLVRREEIFNYKETEDKTVYFSEELIKKFKDDNRTTV
jgi:hypothetical protein